MTEQVLSGQRKSEEQIGSQIELVSGQILKIARSELYLKMRFLDVALSSFVYVLDGNIDRLGTDGFYMYYHPQHLGGMYRENRILVNRAYLHVTLHCIFRHLIRRKGREVNLWNLACDIVTESMVDSMNHRCIRISRSWLRRETYRKLRAQMKVLTPEKVYNVLEEWNLDDRDLMKYMMKKIIYVL